MGPVQQKTEIVDRKETKSKIKKKKSKKARRAECRREG
jgi:hypothetical protein